MATRLALPTVLVGLVLGIVAADADVASVALGAAALAGVAVAVLVPLRSPGIALACAALTVGLLLGAWRGASVALPTGPGTVSGLVDRGEVELAGRVVDDPRPGGSTQQVVLDELVGRIDGHIHDVRGRVLATVPRAVPLAVGERVVVEGVVEAPAAFDAFDYPAYLARQGIGGLVRTHVARVI
jgi:predicted membrane metal-binding protein